MSAARSKPSPRTGSGKPPRGGKRGIVKRQLPAIEQALADAAGLSQRVQGEAERIATAVAMCATALRRDQQVFFCGNGGSAAQASHLAGELSGRFYVDRHAIRALALTDNHAAITAIANDYGFDRIFDRQLEAYADPGDVLVALTTSGGSPNVRHAVRWARNNGLATIGLTGSRGRSFARLCDLAFVAPSTDTARIQEIHLLIGHLICAQVEAELFPSA